MTAVSIDHIVLDEKGRPCIVGTRTRVTQIVRDLRISGSADKIHEEHDYLSLAQIHAALSYYYDHQAVLDANMEEEDKFVEQMRAASKQPSREELVRRYREKFGREPGEG